MMAAIADDWHHELRDYPAWAIQNACRWWMGEDNPERKRRPLPGDIGARCRHETREVRFAQHSVQRFDRGQVVVSIADAGEPISADRAAEITQRAGFTPRRFGGE